jgi:hypothetical protein
MKCAGYKLPVPQWSGNLRRCVVCNDLDRPTYSGEADESGAPIFNHYVVIDLVFIDRAVLNAKEKREGYEYQMVASRHAKVRVICRPCLEASEETRKAWSDYDAQRIRDQEEQEHGTSFYAILCGE